MTLILKRIKNSPLVSIVINNYNYDSFLAKAINSALNQTYSPVEIIVVDDSSTDSSREAIALVKDNLDEDKITSVFKKNGGQASAYNAGFAASKKKLSASSTPNIFFSLKKSPW